MLCVHVVHNNQKVGHYHKGKISIMAASEKLFSVKLNEEDVTKYGIDVLTKLGEDLLSFGAPGIHFYTINKLEPTKAIVESLKL